MRALRVESVAACRLASASSIIIASPGEAQTCNTPPIDTTVEEPIVDISVALEVPADSSEKDDNTAPVPSASVSERATRSRSKAALSAERSEEPAYLRSSLSNDAEILVSEPNGIVSLVTKQQCKERLRPLSLWVRHLEILMQAETLRGSAVGLALGAPLLPSGKPRPYGTPAQRGLLAVLVNVARTTLALRTSVPAAEADPLLVELKELWEECDEACDAKDAAQIRGFVQRRLEGKKLRQADFRKAFNTTLYRIRRTQSALTAAWGNLDVPSTADNVSRNLEQSLKTQLLTHAPSYTGSRRQRL